MNPSPQAMLLACNGLRREPHSQQSTLHHEEPNLNAERLEEHHLNAKHEPMRDLDVDCEEDSRLLSHFLNMPVLLHVLPICISIVMKELIVRGDVLLRNKDDGVSA